MTQSNEWYSKPNVYKFVYSEDVTMAEVEAANKAFKDELDKAEADKVHLLVDTRNATKVGFGLGDLAKNPVLGQTAVHPKLGYILYYDNNNPFHNMISTMIGGASQSQVVILESEEKALEHLRTKTGLELAVDGEGEKSE